jgi:HtrA serine peptidase 2
MLRLRATIAQRVGGSLRPASRVYHQNALRNTASRHGSAFALAASGALTLGALALYQHRDRTAQASFIQDEVNNAKRRAMNFIADAVQVAEPSLVHITNTHQTIFGEIGTGGSGFVVSADGFVATNAHVVLLGGMSRGRLKVAMFDGTEYEGEVWAVDTATDLALIKLDLNDEKLSRRLVPASIGKSSELRSGEWVVALGSPLNLQNSVTVGVVSSTARHGNELGMPDRPFDFIQTDAAINSGNSGGPLINLEGQVVGINTMKAAGHAAEGGVSGISFAIPIDVAWPVLQQLKEFRRVKRPFLGLRMVTLDAHVKSFEKNRNLPTDQVDGVLVLNVAPGSPAERGGVRVGDIIIKMDDKKIKDASDVVRALGFEVGKKLSMQIRRGAEVKTLTVVTEAMPSVTF